MAKGGETKRAGDAEAFDFPLATKRKLKAQRKKWILADSENLFAEFQRLRSIVNWDALRQASTEEDVNAAFSHIDKTTRDRLPSAAAVLATVQDREYPKLRPIRFLAESCALARTYPNSGVPYSPRYSRDICYHERKRRGPAPKPITNLEFWQGQAELEQKVPRKYLRRINQLQAAEQARSKAQRINTELTYVDIPEKMDGMKKKRTTIWLPQTTVARLKKLSAATGAPMAELFRRAVEAYLKAF